MKLVDLQLLREQAYVNGQWIVANDSTCLALTNSADGKTIAQVSSPGQAETTRTIATAQAALPVGVVRPLRNAEMYCAHGSS